MVDFDDEPNATFMTGDAKYCWDWVWRGADRNKAGNAITRDDVLKNNIDAGPSWSLVDMCFNDFAYTKSDREIYKRPLKFNAHWIAPDGALSPVMRQVNMPVLKSFRTAGIVRGPHPYVLVVDDAQRDPMPARYDWNLTLSPDIVSARLAQPDRRPGDIVLSGTGSLDTSHTVKPGEPALLIRILDWQGRTIPGFLGLRQNTNILSIRTSAIDPKFKILIQAFRAGDPLPQTEWNTAHSAVTVSFPDQKDTLAFNEDAAGKTDLVVSRAGSTLAHIDKPVPPLADTATDAITERLREIPVRLAALRTQAFNPTHLPGFLAGWNFDSASGGMIQPLAGSIATATAIPVGDRQWVSGINGRQALATGSSGIEAPANFSSDKRPSFTVACWVKTRSDPSMGGLVNVDGLVGSEFVQGTLRVKVLRDLNDNWASSMLSSWTHLVFTCDGKQLCAYRNGILLSSAPVPDGARFGWGRKFSLGGRSPYGDAEVATQSIHFYNTALSPDDVQSLYLWGKYAQR